MGSPCELLVESGSESTARQLTQIIADEAWRIEDKFSRYLPGNIVDRINRGNGEPVEVDEETANLIDFAATLTEMSEGLFDITSGVLREAWKFDGSDKLPDTATVTSILERVGWHKLDWSRPLLTLQSGMQIDLGGIGKEYAVDKAAALLRELTTDSCLINFGGDIFATGVSTDRRGWQVGIEAPDSDGRIASKIIHLKNGGLATSGDARRFLLKDGIRYGHILNPKTGWPVTNAPRSITVAADTCTQAGMLATLAMLRGADAESFLNAQDVKHWCYF
ncbi:MAG: FAD:protein FMN transferase [Proteobacteria bacterium]|nr:FAD:protein FMN transferase [Pseudomonadota bacterium]MDA0992012.1 FAD:protein FMN transferase [Pseudomonadota bacterium]